MLCHKRIGGIRRTKEAFGDLDTKTLPVIDLEILRQEPFPNAKQLKAGMRDMLKVDTQPLSLSEAEKECLLWQ